MTPYERILRALNIERHLAGRQLARLLYPEEYKNDASRIYQRVMKNLKTMEREGLLQSDSYGVKIEGKEKLWRIFPTASEDSPKRNQERILAEFGVTPTNWKIHRSLYEHEKSCGDIFVSLVLTGRLVEWQGEGDQKAGFRHDRLFRIDDPVNYLEEERGNQGLGKLRDKLTHYADHFRKNRQPFNVLFAVDTEPEIERLAGLFEEFKLGNSYGVVLQDELVLDPLSARVTTRFDTLLAADFCSNYHSKYVPSR